jgi:hypothetical protein
MVYVSEEEDASKWRKGPPQRQGTPQKSSSINNAVELQHSPTSQALTH